MRLRSASALLAVLLAAGLTACSEEDRAPGTEPTRTISAAALADPAAGEAAAAAARAYLDAYLNKRPEEVCALQTPESAREQLENAIALGLVKTGATCTEFVQAVLAASTLATPTPGAAPIYEVTATEATADQAKVRVTYPGSAGANPATFALVQREGRWLVSDPTSE